MGSTEEKAALAAVQATSVPIHDIGTAIYLSPDVFEWAAEWGWSNPFAFYFAGRGGMLGEVTADVVTAAMGWFAPPAASVGRTRAASPIADPAAHAAQPIMPITMPAPRAALVSVGPDIT